MKKAICLILTVVLFASCSREVAPVAVAPGEVSVDQAMTVPIEQELPPFDTEEYDHQEENIFVSTLLRPFSTFAADVDTASYANLRRLITSGQDIPKDAVRIEEMLNYFSYNYKEPSDDEPFGITTEIIPTPWNAQTKLMLIGLQAKKVELQEKPSNLVFLLDVSGSMDAPDKLPLVKKAFLLLTENLQAKDRVSIVTYASDDRILIDGAAGDDRAEIMQAIENLHAGGSTHGSKGILSAYDLARKHFMAEGNNRVILATDGDLNVGITSEGELIDLIKEQKKDGVFLSVMGFGTGNLKDNKLQSLADHGDGNYYYIDSALEARKVLIEEMGSTLYTVAKDVKFQLDFNPAMIKGYRLIGYENRLLNDTDFADDTKDGGEIGSGHRVTALYELVDKDSTYELPQLESKYANSEANSSADELLTLKIRYKEPDGDRSRELSYPLTSSIYSEQPSENLQLASALAEFGMILKDSAFVAQGSLDHVLERLEQFPSKNESIEELIYLVKQVQRMKK